MATQPERIVLTYEDYLEVPNDRNRYELLEGQLEVNPAPNTAHQRAVLGLAVLLGDYVRANGLGEVFIAPYDVLLSEITVVQPDVVFVSMDRASIVLPAHIRGVPDLVVEVVSPTSGRLDRQLKPQVYARHGVPHYWLVDPAKREIVASTLADGSYVPMARGQGGATISAAPFPDLEISLAELWR